MRILVYGAGVQGCQLAHSLAQNKKNVVTLLARGEWKAVIDQKGLTIRHMLQRKTTVDRMQTTDVLAPEDVYDLVFVTVQAGQLADVLPILKANRSQYFIFVGNDPYAQEMLQAMQRPVDKIAFGFQNNAGRREHDRLVSVHMGMGMTVGGATAPLSGAFRLRLQAAFEGDSLQADLLQRYGRVAQEPHCLYPALRLCLLCGGWGTFPYHSGTAQDDRGCRLGVL